MTAAAGLRAGIDTGGTFTDLVLLDERTGTLTVAKRPSSSREPARAVFDTFAEAGVELVDVNSIVVGTTIATNAMLERRGAEVVYITTAGFEDVPVIGRIDKQDPYDLHRVKPEALVQRDRCLGVRERIGWDGTVLEPLDGAALDQLENALRARLAGLPSGHEVAVAVNLLFAFANEQHEELLGRFLDERFPGLAVSLSHRVSPIWREDERASTTIADAFLKPVVGRFVQHLLDGLAARSFAGTLASDEVERRPDARRRRRRPAGADGALRPRGRNRRRARLRRAGTRLQRGHARHGRHERRHRPRPRRRDRRR